jgi:P22_AR N-terminal domain
VYALLLSWNEGIMSTELPQQVIPFYGDELVAVQKSDGTIFVPLGRLCINLELEQQSQARRIHRHAVLKEGLETLTVQTTGGRQSIQCLKLTLLPLWLSGIQASRIGDTTLQEKLIRYQREAADVLWQAFRPQILQESAPLNQESNLAIAQLEQIVEQSKAMQRMAEE